MNIAMFNMPAMKDIKMNQDAVQSGASENGMTVHPFEKLLGEMNATNELETKPLPDESIVIDSDNPEEIQKMLSELDLETMEKLISDLVSSNDLSPDDLLLVEEMKLKLMDLQQSGEQSAESVIEMASNQLLKEMMNLVQPPINFEKEFLSLSSQALSIAEVQKAHVGNLSTKELQHQAQQIFNQVESVLKQIGSGGEVSRVAPKVLELLKQWQQLSQTGGNKMELISGLNTDNKQFLNVWRELTSVYQKRTGMNQRQHYNLDAKVTTTDITRWLGKAMETQVQLEKPVMQSGNPMPQLETLAPQTATAATAMPMSKVEQFVIHLNQTQNNVPVDKQLVEQFQKIMDASKVSHLQNGKGQLSIHLKPANLGEMMVRFTQINGEMLVKILVSTAVAKEMLEGNLQQLRNMFSPHQVVIEKQEGLTQENQKSQEQQNSDRQDERREGRTESELDNNQADEDTFSSLFEELILNEKV